jgi:uncharacterized membrane protein YsdA (DUF1294 family)
LQRWRIKQAFLLLVAEVSGKTGLLLFAEVEDKTGFLAAAGRGFGLDRSSCCLQRWRIKQAFLLLVAEVSG